MSIVLKFEQLTKQTQDIVEDAYKTGDLTEEQFESIKKNGITDEEWKKSVLAAYLGGQTPADFDQKPAETEAPSTPPQLTGEEDEYNQMFDKFRKTLSFYDEKMIKVLVRKRNDAGLLVYIKGGGSLRWNISEQSFSDLLETIAKKFGAGDYHLTFQPSRADIKIKPFARSVIIESCEQETPPTPQYLQPPASGVSGDNIKEVLSTVMNQFTAMFNNIQLGNKEQQLQFSKVIDKNNSEVLNAIKEMAMAVRYTSKNPPDQKDDVFAVLEKVTALAEKLNKKSNANIDIRKEVQDGIKEYKEILKEGIELGRSQLEEEFSDEEEERLAEEERVKEKKGNEFDFDPQAGMGDIAGSILKKELGMNMQDIIKTGVSAIKNWLEKQPTEEIKKITPTQEQVAQTVKIGNVEAPVDDMKLIITALNELEKQMASAATDEQIASWVKQAVAPSQLPQLKQLAPEFLKNIFLQVKPSLVKDVDRVVRIFSLA